MNKILQIYKSILSKNKNIKLTNKEKEVLYKYKGIYYQDINNFLRNKRKTIEITNEVSKNVKLEDILKKDFEKIKEDITALDNVLQKVKKIEHAVTVYRGIRLSGNNAKSFLEELEKNKKMQNKEFLSVSFQIETAKSFSYYVNNKIKEDIENIIFIINIPKNAKLFPLTWERINEQEKEIIQHSEMEFLLPRDSTFLLQKIKRQKLEVPLYRWKNLNKILKKEFVVCYVDYKPPKNLSKINFDINNYEVIIKDPNVMKRIMIL